ncbi:MAG: LysR family transcriptional regulator [Oscillospiraceae bacterium]|jgi:DNA-binding transcriptional LysR family regulator
MTITQLKYFIALAETLNFSEVAERFFVAQTAISYNIKSLEKELGAKLFIRSTKKTSLTEAGYFFYSKVKIALQIIEQVQKEIKHGQLKQTLVIGCSRLCSGPTIFGVVHQVQKSHPGFTLILTSDEPELTLFEKLKNGQIDLAVYLNSPFTQRPADSITKRFYANIPRKLIVSQSHPFAACKEGIHVSRTYGERIVTYGDLEQILLMTPNADEVKNRTQPPVLVNDFQALLNMIGANLGIACLPMLDDLVTDAVCTIPCIENQPPEQFLSIAATYMKYNNSPYIDIFTDAFFEALARRFRQEQQVNS